MDSDYFLSLEWLAANVRTHLHAPAAQVVIALVAVVCGAVI